MNKVWLVTGSATGLGRNIAEAVLESGDRLVATARDTKRLDNLVKKHGNRVRAVPLGVTDDPLSRFNFLARRVRRIARPALTVRLRCTGCFLRRGYVFDLIGG